MTLQLSGAISISDLVAEFGGSAPHSLSEYYRGGSLVPNTGTNSGVPTSGAISLTDFYGASAAVIAEFTSGSGTYSVPSGYTSCTAYIYGAGGGGSRNTVLGGVNGGGDGCRS